MANSEHYGSTYERFTRVSPNRSGIRLTPSGGISAHEELVREKIAAGDATGMTSVDRRRATSEWKAELALLEEVAPEDWSPALLIRHAVVWSAIDKAASIDFDNALRNAPRDSFPSL